ncbi:CsgG/HfaB family protein [Candidatus Sulfurimonas baltica]|uniref:CsgG/HfaB family protein n=1 Tax=Candidatus Sulfurimonas baltica TaxID=2740404 RepID=A0A7S7RMJ3_9BACT|nr:CsgG/HfaB family protein [Candidatus Sulfurimonas baltica]QOY51390.1 CsgG/HfaB family protein [Candidatus Sulfurimonas baltica]
MTFKKLFIFFGLTLIFTGCATMQHTKTHETPTSEIPEVSKSIKEKKADEPSGLKRKVAIGRFSNETRYGQSFFIDENNDRIGKQAMDILSSKLFETGKFIMLERADLSKIQKELEMEGSSSLKNSADYLILGSITEFGRKEVSDVGIFSRVKKQEAFAKVHIRIVDVSTGQIIYSEEGKGSAYSEAGSIMGVGAKSAYDGQLNDKAIDAAISNLASNIIENMLDKPWRGYILGYEDGNLITSGGKSQNIKVGDNFNVIKEGKKIKNPQTNTMVTLPGKNIATIEIINTIGDTPDTEVSLATVTSGNLNEYTVKKEFSGLYIEVKKDK